MENKFIESSYYDNLRKDILSGYRHTGHALDNYGMVMSAELKKALEGLYEAHRAVLEAMNEDIKNSGAYKG